MVKYIVLHSGGLDSTVLLYYILSKEYQDPVVKPEEVVSLSVFYGQRHVKELEASKKVCELLNVKHEEILLPLERILNRSALIDTSKDLPEEHYTHANQQITVVPNRNMIFISIAAAYAENIGAKYVFYAAHKNDFSIYLDCRPKWVRAVSKAVELGTYNSVKVEAPFVDLYKVDLVRLGAQLNVPFEFTWSCYRGEEFPCSFKDTKVYSDTKGKGCATCQERNEAFFECSLIDPLYMIYQKSKEKSK